MAANAAWLQKHPTISILVEGHCDERGTREYNLALGARRANSVQEYLVSRGVADNRLKVVSYGKERPIEICSEEACYAKNRRAVTVISAVHDLTLAAQFCDRLVMLSGGSIVAEGSAEGVLTADTIRRHYGARVRVISDGDGLIVIPIRAGDSREAGGSGRMASHR